MSERIELLRALVVVGADEPLASQLREMADDYAELEERQQKLQLDLDRHANPEGDGR